MLREFPTFSLINMSKTLATSPGYGVLDARYVKKSGDTMTGALSIAVSSGNALIVNTDDFVVDTTNGRVGIGIAAPTRTLEVNGDGRFAAEVLISVAGENSGAFKTFKTGESSQRFEFTNQGDMKWGPGTSGGDTDLIRRAINRLQTYGGFYVGPYSTPVIKLEGTTGASIFNEEGAAVDTRFEGDTDANLLMVHGALDNVGIGIAAPSEKLFISKVNSAADVAIALRNNSTTANSTASFKFIGNTGTTVFSQIKSERIDTNTGKTYLSTRIGAALEDWGIMTATEFVFNDAGNDRDFRIESDTDANNFFSDGGANRVGIGEGVPDYKLDVNGTFGFTPGTSVTPVDNGDVVFEFTNDTTLTVKGKGSDSTVRTATITLA